MEKKIELRENVVIGLVSLFKEGKKEKNDYEEKIGLVYENRGRVIERMFRFEKKGLIEGIENLGIDYKEFKKFVVELKGNERKNFLEIKVK